MCTTLRTLSLFKQSVSVEYRINTYKIHHTPITNKDELERNMPSMSNCVCRSTTTACRQPPTLPLLFLFCLSASKVLSKCTGSEQPRKNERNDVRCGAMWFAVQCHESNEQNRIKVFPMVYSKLLQNGTTFAAAATDRARGQQIRCE